MARTAQPYPSLPTLQAALAATLARVRETSYVGSPAPGGPCIMRICDEEFRLDAVVVIGEPDSPEASRLLCDAVEDALQQMLGVMSGGGARHQSWAR